MATDKRREKSANYTHQEKHLLLNKIFPYLRVIENKKTDTLTVDAKLKSWTDIAAQYNMVNSKQQRRVGQLKTLYENIKKRTKRDILAYQAELKVGGGKNWLRRIDDVGWRLIKTVPSFKALWRSTLLMKQQATRIDGESVTTEENESLLVPLPSPMPDAPDYSVAIKEELMPNGEEFITEGELEQINNIHNQTQQPSNFNHFPTDIDENKIRGNDDNRNSDFEPPDDLHDSIYLMEREIKKRELQKLDLDIQMKKLELELMKGRLKEQEMDLKFRKLEYQIKRQEFDRNNDDWSQSKDFS